jgi:hypothetical protein
MAKPSTVVACSWRAAKQERLRNLEAKKEEYRAASRVADEAQRQADLGEITQRRVVILREAATLIANDANHIAQKIPAELINGCSDTLLKAEWGHSRTVRLAKSNAYTKAAADLEESKRLLRKVEQDLDRFFPDDGWKKVVGADGIWRPKLTRVFNENMREELERSAVTLQHSLQILQRVADEAANELEAARAAYDAARQALIWSPI